MEQWNHFFIGITLVIAFLAAVFAAVAVVGGVIVLLTIFL
jgi:hypothetical protein